MKIVYAVAVAAVALLPVPAEAAPITYTLTGVMDGSLGTGGFSGAKFTLVGTGDTADLFYPVGPGVPAVTLSSVKITYDVFGPQTVMATDAIAFFVNQIAMGAGLADISTMSDVIDFGTAGIEMYDAVSSFGPLPAMPFNANGVMTDHGEFTFLRVSSLTFQAVTADAVPEPGTFLILGAGLLGLGWSVRRRARAG
jgi:hypothetical protein